jgi:hypothetical protein
MIVILLDHSRDAGFHILDTLVVTTYSVPPARR